MLDAVSRATFLALARSRFLKRVASRYGMRGPHAFARRFIAGEAVDEAIAVARALERDGFTHTLNRLGEHVRTLDEANRATQAYATTIDRVGRAGLPCKVSIKLSQLGLELDRDGCLHNLRLIADRAGAHDGFVRVDMEGSGLLDETLAVFDAVWSEGRRNVGLVLQSYLYRTDDDLTRLLARGVRIRLVKGAYREPPELAYRHKADVDRAFVRHARLLLDRGVTPAIATHDPRILDAVCRYAQDHGLARDRFELQLLYGVRRDLQASLLARGYHVRVYLPFGDDWFPYFMRRLAERPANVAFVVKSILYEQKG